MGTKNSKQFEKATYFLLKTGATVGEIEAMFKVDDLGEDVKAFQMAKYYGWTLADINELTLDQHDRAYAYMAAVAKMSEDKK